MAQSQDFRTQSSAPETPGAGVARYYVNNSGILRFVNSAGTDFAASTFFPTTGQASVVTSGQVVFTNGGTLGVNVTGVAYGTTGVGTVPIILGAPQFWLSATGPNGQLLSVPAYTRTA